MYRSILKPRERAGAIFGVLLVHIAIALAVLNAGGGPVLEKTSQSPPLDVYNVDLPPEPPPEVQVMPENPAPQDEGAASPPNVRSEATPVTAPEPEVIVPRQTPVVATTTPAEGAEATQGAAPVAGPGTGAGGVGTGTGSGGSGSGPGGGGAGGTRPQLISGQFRTRHYPRALQEAWAYADAVLVTFQVQTDGRVTGCRVYESSGNAEIDRETCRLAETRLRFRPALDEQGRPTVASYGYRQARTR